MNLYFPAIIPLLLSNFAGWYSRMAADAGRLDKLMTDFFCAFTRMASLCQHPPTAAILNGYHLQSKFNSIRFRLPSITNQCGCYQASSWEI